MLLRRTTLVVLMSLVCATSAPPAGAQCAFEWKPGLPGMNASVEALTAYTGKLIAAGLFDTAGGNPVGHVAQWDGSSWSAVGTGIDDNVIALTVYNGNLIAGGRFITTGDGPAIHVAQWDADQWSPLGGGVGNPTINEAVFALAVYDDKLIAGGYFGPSYIAQWDGTSWSPLGTGMDARVDALMVNDGKLIAGGQFTTAGGMPAIHIAQWDGYSWSALGSGLASQWGGGDVLSLGVYDGKLIAGGRFSTTGGPSDHIGQWNGLSWSPVGAGLADAPCALTVYNGNLIAAGWNRIAQWDGGSWSFLGAGLNDLARALTVYDGHLIAGGYFTTAGGPPENPSARWARWGSENQPPTAVAGDDQAIHAGHWVFLDGSASFDDNTENLGYAWALTQKPVGSTAELMGADTATPTFFADLPETYELSLVVTDECGVSGEPDTVTISSQNVAPTANAGADVGTYLGETVQLDGAGSVDPDNDQLAYAWAIAVRPDGSTAPLDDTSSPTPTLTPDLPGQYTVQLVVNDGFADSPADQVVIAVVTPEEFAETTTMEGLNLVVELPPTTVTTTGNQTAMGNFHTQAIAALQAGDVQEAINKLNKAISRTDGCVLRGAPDGSGPGRDWITDCAAQEELYWLLMDALDAISP